MTPSVRLILALVSGILASLLCFCAGGYLLFQSKGDTLIVGLGLYFLGKSFFVGPMIALTAMPAGRSVA